MLNSAHTDWTAYHLLQQYKQLRTSLCAAHHGYVRRRHAYAMGSSSKDYYLYGLVDNRLSRESFNGRPRP